MKQRIEMIRNKVKFKSKKQKNPENISNTSNTLNTSNTSNIQEEIETVDLESGEKQQEKLEIEQFTTHELLDVTNTIGETIQPKSESESITESESLSIIKIKIPEHIAISKDKGTNLRKSFKQKRLPHRSQSQKYSSSYNEYQKQMSHQNNNPDKDNHKEKKKIIIFDMDETLGYFTQFGVLYDVLTKYYNKSSFTQEVYNKLLDVYDKYLRPNIVTVLKYIAHKKQIDNTIIVAIFTNNPNLEWCNHIKEYFHYKVQYPIFDDLITLYEKDNRIIDSRRTSNEKLAEDIYTIFSSTKEECEILFVDDIIHENMIQDNIYYVHVYPYVYHYKPEKIASKFVKAFQEKIPALEHGYIEDYIHSNVKNYAYLQWYKYEINLEDREETKKIMQLLHKFFQMKHNKTRKLREKPPK